MKCLSSGWSGSKERETGVGKKQEPLLKLALSDLLPRTSLISQQCHQGMVDVTIDEVKGP